MSTELLIALKTEPKERFTIFLSAINILKQH